MFIIDDILAAKAAGKMLPMLIGVGITVSAGIGLAEFNERKMPWGLGHRLHHLEDTVGRQILDANTKGHRDQVAFDSAAVDKDWRPALAQCHAELTAASNSGADYLDSVLAAGTHSRDTAFQLGAASCRGRLRSEKTGTAGSPVTRPVGLRDGDVDLRNTLAGSAYRAPRPADRPGHR